MGEQEDTVARPSAAATTPPGARAPSWAQSVVYQIYPRSFADSDGDGHGDLRGVLSKLDHLHWLGVDVVWLSPFYPSPQHDGGYDISDYEDVDPRFGTLDDLDALVAALHARGMRLMLDLVVNHTSDEHPWFVEARRDPNGARRDWYWWRPPRPGSVAGAPGAEPNNWRSAFSGPAWTLDESGEYYLHLFSRHQPDLNWENPDVRSAIHRMVRWWLDRGVDGLRMDVINFISKNVDLPDGRPQAGVAGTGSMPALGDGAPHYVGGPRLLEFLDEMRKQALAGHDGVLTVGEMPSVTVAQARSYTNLVDGPLDMVFQFEHVVLDDGPGGKFDPRPLRPGDLADSLERWQIGLADAWNTLYLSNHDQPRAVSRFGDERRWRFESAKALATMLHLHRGTPFVYQGEEIAMGNTWWRTLDDLRDVESLNHFRAATAAGQDPAVVLAVLRRRSRDNARTPMQWDSSPNAGFTSGTPWIGVNPDHVTVNVAAQHDDPASVLHHYRRLISLRRAEPCIAWGDYRRIRLGDDRVYAFTRSLDGTTVGVVVNLSSDAVTGLDWPQPEPWHTGELLLGTEPGEAPPGRTLAPWEFQVRRHRVDTGRPPTT